MSLLVHSIMGQVAECPQLTNPLNGSTNVPVGTTITWNSITGVTGYIISIGTTPGGTDIVNNQPVGNATSFTPPLGLPDNTRVFVTLSLFFLNSSTIQCPSESFTTEDITTSPPCTTLVSPANGATNVPVATNIRWALALGADAYLISIGTTPGGSEIANNVNVGNVLEYNPPVNLPPSTQIYVRITPINENGNAINCTEESFITRELGNPPSCTTLITPENGAINVPLTPELRWNPVADATGYRMSIGTTPFTTDILADADLGNVTSVRVINFLPNTTAFVTIVPYNEAGRAIGCTYEVFTTIGGCGPFIDPETSELITLNPENNLPEVIGICSNNIPLEVSSPDDVDGYVWIRINNDGSESIISEERSALIEVEGNYRLIVYNLANQSGFDVRCETPKEFRVIRSQPPVITSINVVTNGTSITVTVNVSGNSEYEYALNNIDGPYQDSNVFTNVPVGNPQVFVRDKNGCGIVSEFINAVGFPKFFTPNGDNINDTWRLNAQTLNGSLVTVVHIFDRFGKLVNSFSPDSIGWDGTYNGRPLPSSDYWFKAILENGTEVRGHFTLKR